MYKGLYSIIENRPLAESTFLLRLGGEHGFTGPGQFGELALPGKFLRRPFSVCGFEKGEFSVIYRISGGGTELLSRLSAGEKLDALTGLGTGFDLEKSGKTPLMVGGGTGASPMYALAKALLAAGARPAAALGFGRSEDVFFADEFKALGIEVILATVDGSAGEKGNITDHLPADASYIYACGPQAMLKALDALPAPGAQYSLEARMGCGFGACMGCTINTARGPKRVCRDGPVFCREDIIW